MMLEEGFRHVVGVHLRRQVFYSHPVVEQPLGGPVLQNHRRRVVFQREPASGGLLLHLDRTTFTRDDKFLNTLFFLEQFASSTSSATRLLRDEMYRSTVPLPPPHPRPAMWAHLRAPCAWNVGSAHFMAHHPAHVQAPPPEAPAPEAGTARPEAEEFELELNEEWAARLCAAYARKQRGNPAERERRSRRRAARPPVATATRESAPPSRNHEETPTRVTGSVRALYGVSHRQVAAREAELNAQFDERARSGRYPWPAM